MVVGVVVVVDIAVVGVRYVGHLLFCVLPVLLCVTHLPSVF